MVMPGVPLNLREKGLVPLQPMRAGLLTENPPLEEDAIVCERSTPKWSHLLWIMFHSELLEVLCLFTTYQIGYSSRIHHVSPPHNVCAAEKYLYLLMLDFEDVTWMNTSSAFEKVLSHITVYYSNKVRVIGSSLNHVWSHTNQSVFRLPLAVQKLQMQPAMSRIDIGVQGKKRHTLWNQKRCGAELSWADMECNTLNVWQMSSS